MSLVTKKALAHSLKKLMTQTSLEKLTVKDIVTDCGVNRQTFYLLMGVVEEVAARAKVQPEDKKFIADFYSYAFIGILISRLQAGAKEKRNRGQTLSPGRRTGTGFCGRCGTGKDFIRSNQSFGGEDRPDHYTAQIWIDILGNLYYDINNLVSR